MELQRQQFGRTWTHYALDRKVLVVATKGDIDDWCAYIGPVAGQNHTEEASEVARTGTRIPYWMAAKLFPSMDKQYQWRE
jgi:hypothetical protein